MAQQNFSIYYLRLAVLEQTEYESLAVRSANYHGKPNC